MNLKPPLGHQDVFMVLYGCNYCDVTAVLHSLIESRQRSVETFVDALVNESLSSGRLHMLEIHQ